MFSPVDLEQLKRHGISQAEAERQMALLAHGAEPVHLLRPCKLGDGVMSLPDADQRRLERIGQASLQRGGWAKFVPASGAATRMFKDLALQQAKGLIPFHLVHDQTHTAFEDQLREGAALLANAQGLVRLHFTVSPEHQADFESLLAGLKPKLEKELDVRLAVEFSQQDPASDTLAGADAGQPFRDAEGRLVFRPGGHGALLRNLQKMAERHSMVLIKNIDNIAHPRLWPEILRWKRVLAGLLDETQNAVFEWLQRIEREPSREGEALAWAEKKLGIMAQGQSAASLLRRPLRVCGVVPNTGEPGGGPFWVEREGLLSLQIIESAQIHHEDPAQKAILAASTHFNPVDLACGLHDEKGQPYDLQAFVDEGTSFISKKTQQGQNLWALERPGLWNGAMAAWNTLLVEVPLMTFNPVKTLSDLLRPEHQP